MRELLWTRFAERNPTDERKAVAVQYKLSNKLVIAVMQPGSWNSDTWDCENDIQWAYDDPIAPPCEPVPTKNKSYPSEALADVRKLCGRTT